MNSEYIFPRRLDRRDFLLMAGAAMGAVTMQEPAESQGAVRIGTGSATYTLDEAWGKLPEGMRFGLGCAIVVDSKDRVIVTSRSTDPCIAIFDRDGKLLETWSADFGLKIGYSPQQVSQTAHGLYLSNEGGTEYLYFTENAPGNRVYKTDMRGRILFQLGKIVGSGSATLPFSFVNPTDVAVAPNGDVYVVDGYGSQLVHRFDRNFKHLKTMGGRGTEHGKFNVCHGIWINTLKKEPEVYIADRANNRCEVYSLELEYKRSIGELRLPCCFYQSHGKLFIPELGARVSILDEKDQVVGRLGDGQGMKREEVAANPGKFFTPHAMTVDSRGDFYLVEWIDFGRVRKFRHTPA